MLPVVVVGSYSSTQLYYVTFLLIYQTTGTTAWRVARILQWGRGCYGGLGAQLQALENCVFWGAKITTF